MEQDAKAVEALAAGRGLDSNLEINGTARATPEIPEHQLLKRIGGGSYGEVWLAQNAIGTFHAVKIIYRNAFSDERPFEREFQGIQNAMPISRSSPGLVHILQVGRNDDAGYFYYVMELADGEEMKNEKCKVQNEKSRAAASDAGEQGAQSILNFEFYIFNYRPRTLSSELKSCGPLPVEECVQLGLTLTSALAHLHEQGLVHRDIKPSNIIFVRGVPKLADIGLMADASAAQSFVGTAGFIPPEGPGSPQADLYSLGKVLYEMSTGKDRQDFPELPVELILGSTRAPRVESGAPPDSSVSDMSLLDAQTGKVFGEAPKTAREARALPLLELNSIIVKACETDFRKRYQTAQQMHDDLALLEAGHSIKRKRTMERRVVFTKIFGAIAVVVGLLFASVVFLSNRQSEQKRIRRQEAQKLYEKARTYSRGTKDGITKATELLNQAILADPDFAQAYAYLAQVNLEAAGWHVSPKQALTEAKKNAIRARLLDPSLAQAHMSLALILFNLDRDWAGAEAEFKRAIELGPTNAWSYVSYAHMLSALGRFDDADAVLKRAEELNPTSQVVLTTIGWRYYQERQFTNALVPAVKTRALHPNDPVSHQLYASVQERLKNYPEALAAAQRARELDSVPDLIALVGFVQARAGQRAKAEKTLHELNVVAETSYVSPIYQAWLYAGLGDVDKVVEHLKKAHEELPLHPALLRTEPKWDEVRNDPQFVALLQKLGLEQ